MEGIEKGTILLGYELLEKLGEGGWGQVWKAQSAEGKVVAVKILIPKNGWEHKNRILMKERFRREVAVISQLRSPYSVHAIGGCGDVAGGTLAFVMDYLEGQTLRHFVGIGNRPTSEQIRRWTAQLLDAMNEFHGMGIVHRDIKPDNIMLLPNGNIKLFDFGICKDISTDSNLTTQQAPRSVLYASPEQLLDADTIDSRSDYYSLGKVIYYLSTGTTPPAGMLGDHINEISDFLLRHIVEMLTVEDVAMRADNIEELWKNDFKWLLSDDATTVDMGTDGEEPTSVDLPAEKEVTVGERKKKRLPSGQGVLGMTRPIIIVVCIVLSLLLFYKRGGKNEVRFRPDTAIDTMEYGDAEYEDSDYADSRFTYRIPFDSILQSGVEMPENLISEPPKPTPAPNKKEAGRDEPQEQRADWKSLSPDKLDAYCRQLLPRAKRGDASARKDLFEIYRNNQGDISAEVMSEIQSLAE